MKMNKGKKKLYVKLFIASILLSLIYAGVDYIALSIRKSRYTNEIRSINPNRKIYVYKYTKNSYAPIEALIDTLYVEKYISYCLAKPYTSDSIVWYIDRPNIPMVSFPTSQSYVLDTLRSNKRLVKVCNYNTNSWRKTVGYTLVDYLHPKNVSDSMRINHPKEIEESINNIMQKKYGSK